MTRTETFPVIAASNCWRHEPDSSGRIRLVAFGHSSESLFPELCQGLMALVTPLRRIRAHHRLTLTIRAASLPELVTEWLDQLIIESHARRMLFRQAKVRQMSETSITIDLYGEKMDPARHHALHRLIEVDRSSVEVSEPGMLAATTDIICRRTEEVSAAALVRRARNKDSLGLDDWPNVPQPRRTTRQDVA